ncbi:MAG: aminotransferase class III-fold pyridoxal phosphate-dependent enzyme, partial [Anaerolineales bacterium]|nr:aminotransferase class III-fold pyridoxal phosphate-dependent enzyme [Anaerolineales bacterium]
MPSVTSLQQSTPAFTLTQASELAQQLYGLSTTASTLPSERDQNFLLTTQGGAQFVLKIANALESRDFLEAQQQAMMRLGPLGQQVQTALNGQTLVARDGYWVWLVSYLPGTPLGKARRHSSELLQDFGAHIGRLTQALAGFDHPAAHRDFHWDLARGASVVEQYLPLVHEPELAALISKLAAQFQHITAPHLAHLPHSLIHNDLNDFNVLVGNGPDIYARQQRLAGILDFGDMVHSYTVGDLAVATAYACLEKPEPLEAVAHMVSGYYAVRPLTEPELACLFSFITLRLCVSVCIAAQQYSLNPENDYLNISQQAIRRTLPQLAKIHPRMAEAVLRQACGLPPMPASEKVTAWLRTASFAPILDVDLRGGDCAVLDLSASSPLVSSDPAQNGEPQLSDLIFRQMQAEGVPVGVGRYDEARLIYTAPFFATGPEFNAERRTIHIGLDLFAEAGTPFYAPLAGTVHALADNAVQQDYGPVIILRHSADDGTPFYTLYGHLSRESLAGLQVGQNIQAGQKLGALGSTSVNGGWTPHLHFQIITDLLELECDFPGVGRASQRAVWRAFSPDPNLLIGIPAHKFPAPEPTLQATLATRRERLGRNLSIAYRRPLKIVRGWKQYLFDADGQRYLDAYNNVPHVGHSHPRVLQAAQNQMAVLNTNTRYLHDVINQYAEKLCATLPEPLRVCFFVNSASEANELALRLARAYTGQRHTIVLEAAYHGHTTSLIDISPYKHNGPGGTGAPDWVHTALIPDTYRGPYKVDDPQAAHKYAQSVA